MTWVVATVAALVGAAAGFFLGIRWGIRFAEMSATATARAEVERARTEAALETIKAVEDAVEVSRAGGGGWHDRLRAHDASADKP